VAGDRRAALEVCKVMICALRSERGPR
jgi:hypothetical protein